MASAASSQSDSAQQKVQHTFKCTCLQATEVIRQNSFPVRMQRRCAGSSTPPWHDALLLLHEFALANGATRGTAAAVMTSCGAHNALLDFAAAARRVAETHTRNAAAVAAAAASDGMQAWQQGSERLVAQHLLQLPRRARQTTPSSAGLASGRLQGGAAIQHLHTSWMDGGQRLSLVDALLFTHPFLRGLSEQQVTRLRRAESRLRTPNLPVAMHLLYKRAVFAALQNGDAAADVESSSHSRRGRVLSSGSGTEVESSTSSPPLLPARALAVRAVAFMFGMAPGHSSAVVDALLLCCPDIRQRLMADQVRKLRDMERNLSDAAFGSKVQELYAAAQQLAKPAPHKGGARPCYHSHRTVMPNLP